VAHVFLSYSSKYRQLTVELAGYFESCGLDVWWDQELASRSPFDAQIQEQLRTAGCIVVIWTEGAATSEWVHVEARYAVTHDRLVAVRTDDFEPHRIPEEFRKYDAHKLVAERDLLLKDVLAVREGRLLLEDRQEKLPPADQCTPTMLLQAKFGVIPFTGSDAVHDDIVDWALCRNAYDKTARRDAGRLIHGPGGLGKTRLLIEVAATLRAERWSAGFLARPAAGDKPEDTAETRSARRERFSKAIGHLIHGAMDRGLLLVIDYAESLADELRAIAQAIRARPTEETRPIRLVLLARGASDWWTRLCQEDQTVGALFGGAQLEVHELRGINSPQDRFALFNKAVPPFAERLVEMGYALPTELDILSGSWRLSVAQATRLEALVSNAGHKPGEGYDRPLNIAMEALLCLAARAPDGNESGVHFLLANILGVERDHWPKLVPLRDDNGKLIDASVKALERAVGQVTGVQGVEGRRSVEDLLMLDGRYPRRRDDRAGVDTVTDNVVKLYGRGLQIVQLEPDLIGEHHVASDRVGDPELLDGCMAWIATLPDKSKRSEHYIHLVTVLQRASRPEHGPEGVARAARLLDHLIDLHGGTLGAAMVKVMGDTPGELFQRFNAKIETLDPSTLEALNFSLPLQHLSWMEFSLRVADRYGRLAWAAMADAGHATEQAERVFALRRAAIACDYLGIRLGKLGRANEALAAFESAVDLKRIIAIAVDRPDTYQSDLGSSLSNFAGQLVSLGRVEEALAASQQAVDLYRAVAREQTQADPLGLATSLDGLGAVLAKLDRGDEALAVSKEAVDICRSLAKEQPKNLLPALATLLHNFHVRLSKSGRREEALAASKESVKILRALANERPDVFLQDLGNSLTSLGSDYFDLERHEEAYAASAESVYILRPLANDRPGSFLPNLASSLSDLSAPLSKLGRHEEALAASLESIAIYQTLAKDQPDAFLPDLAKGLTRISAKLFNLGGYEDALAATRQAVDIYRTLAKNRHEAFLPALARSLDSLSAVLGRLMRRQEALAASEEAVNTYQALTKDRGEVFQSDLASSLHNFGVSLSEVGRGEDAIAALKEAVEVRRALAENQPQVFLPNLARSLVALSQSLAGVGRHCEAAESARDGLEALAPFVESNPQAFNQLARLLCLNHFIACQRAGIEPAAALLERVVSSLGSNVSEMASAAAEFLARQSRQTCIEN
jgi:tetratricopeptide (TPR) repeat protein